MRGGKPWNPFGRSNGPRPLEPAVLRNLYDEAAEGYDRLHGILTLHSDQAGRRLVVEHGVSVGDRVLDAGGGTGSTALLAARKVGPGGQVTVVDQSEGMLEEARRKAQAAGLVDRMEFCTGDMLRLPFGDGTFDAVLSTYSMCPLYDPAAGALELFRVIRPGGRLSAAHSTEPPNPITRWLGRRLEEVVWRIPRLSMGCRPVSTLPALVKAGAQVQFQTLIGVPLYPFIVYTVRKPDK